MEFPDIMESFLLDPTPETRRPLRAAILGDRTFDPRIALREQLGEAPSPQAVLGAIGARMPGLFLSPQAHGLLARAHQALGQESDAERERKLSLLALHEIEDSGTGTVDSPLEVLRVQDEYDHLQATRRRSTAQRLHRTDQGEVDVHTLEDGTELWFRLLWRVPAGG